MVVFPVGNDLELLGVIQRPADARYGLRQQLEDRNHCNSRQRCKASYLSCNKQTGRIQGQWINAGNSCAARRPALLNTAAARPDPHNKARRQQHGGAAILCGASQPGIPIGRWASQQPDTTHVAMTPAAPVNSRGCSETKRFSRTWRRDRGEQVE